MIKPKTHRNCAHKACSKNFKKFKTTDKYCSIQCKLKDTSLPCPKYSNIKPRSKKRAAEERLYNQMVRPFLNKEENKICPVMFHLEGWQLRTSEVHHIKGRIGKLLLYTPYWLAVSSEGHKWIHDNPNKAKALGWMINTTL